MTRTLILSWEYPPLIEGGLARHVRKLAEGLAAAGLDVHVLTRGGEESPAEEVAGGVAIHRVLEPRRPRDLSEFVAWVERMNADMLAAGVELGDRYDFDLVHGHDWLVAMASGCPCIVADTGGLREVVPHDEAGLRFRSRDPWSLARMVERLLGDGALRERLVAEASEHVLRFDWVDVAERTAELYSALTPARTA